MSRKVYLADLAAATRDSSVSNVFSVKASEDGEFNFLCKLPGYETPVGISAAVSDVFDYPTEHSFYVFAAEDAPPAVAEALQLLPSTSAKSISELLSSVSKHLGGITATGSREAPFEIDSDGDTNIPDSQADIEEEVDSDENGVNEDWDSDLEPPPFVLDGTDSGPPKLALNDVDSGRIRNDLIIAKNAGFKVGHFGNLQPGSPCYISISCRIAKLGISEEAMQAWDVERSQYLILLLYYPRGYQTAEKLISTGDARRLLEYRVGLSKSYKPASLDETMRAFMSPQRLNHESRSNYDAVQTPPTEDFHDCFISRPLNAMFRDRFMTILSSRLNFAMSWESAERYFNDIQGTLHSDNRLDSNYLQPEILPKGVPAIVKADEVRSIRLHKEMSLPLISMQFLLRHFVRCPEFCLVCHCKLITDMEAIKPYVCDKPLCLYQYMSLGFGPSIEHEIIAQPCVVDLLISFCYARASAGQLNDFPIGLGFNVPCASSVASFPDAPINMPEPFSQRKAASISKESTEAEFKVSKSYAATMQTSLRDMIVAEDICPFRKGDWILVKAAKIGGDHDEWHTRIEDTTYYPKVNFSEPLRRRRHTSDAVEPLAEDIALSAGKDFSFVIYDQNFDDLSKSQMRSSVCLLMDMLPSIDEIRAWLEDRTSTNLSEWSTRLSPAALGVLRWIIASNRSCIMQVDQPQAQIGARPMKCGEPRVQGVDGWMQFRFATGAPDKEQRFLNAVKSVSSRLALKFPTRFAWHGSSLANWHSIIREGLVLGAIVNGRAFGHGIYHSDGFQVSSGYLSHRGAASRHWPSSRLIISGAIALNEIVNAPKEYVSSTPHFVVSQLDWIQTRYLFVRVSSDVKLPEPPLSSNYAALIQDSDRPPRGPTGQPIQLPVTAVPRSRRIVINESKAAGVTSQITNRTTGGTKLKQTLDSLAGFPTALAKIPVIDLDDDDDKNSVATLPEDLDILFATPENLSPSPPPTPKRTQQLSVPEQVTSFMPTMSIENLPLLPPPSYATPNASKRLQRDFLALFSLQERHIKANTLPELGWHLNTTHMEQTSNLYQWIISMHSFPLTLPLGADMQTRGIPAIVFEIRFHATYPISPPFLRIVRPRFLSFAHGGGGHITAGGSICMDLLTSTNWSPVYDVASVLLQVRMAIMNTDPRPARLEQESRAGGDYGVQEAVSAFVRVAGAHGWQVPTELQEIAAMGGESRRAF